MTFKMDRLVVALCGAVFCSIAIQSSAAGKKSAEMQTFLFVDWNDIEKGRVVPIYDASLLTDEARTNFAERKKDWAIDTRIGTHGTVQYHVPRGIRITVEKAEKTPRWLLPDQPWEAEITGGNVIMDHGLFRCWYSATLPQQKIGIVYAEAGRGMETNGTATCYAESKDGINWTKPPLKIFSYNGSKDNNIVSPIWIDSPFLDKQGTPEERFKAFTFDELPADEVPKGAGAFSKYGLYGMVSPDGYHWSRLPRPLVRHFCDSWNIAGWDPQLKKYVGFFRGHEGGRSITRAETTDFHQWPMPETLLCTGPEDSPSSDFYSSGYTTYPGIPSLRLMFAGIYHLETSLVDVRLAVSRDSYGWNWVTQQPVIECGRTNEWDWGMIFGQPNLCRLGDGRLALCYTGYDHGHETDFGKSYRDWPKPETGLAWAVWGDGRLAGVEADRGGDFYAVNPARNVSAIQINARTAAEGRVEVELVDKDQALPGFTFQDCVPITGDQSWTPVRFKRKDGLSELRDRKFQIHFRLVNAKVFGYRTVGF
jgi:hypothetical protein